MSNYKEEVDFARCKIINCCSFGSENDLCSD